MDSSSLTWLHNVGSALRQTRCPELHTLWGYGLLVIQGEEPKLESDELNKGNKCDPHQVSIQGGGGGGGR